jgi:dTDP-4-dehydrorhamnose 3,5-epimerase
MDVKSTKISGVLVITPQVYMDERGWFMEVWDEQLQEIGIPPFKQLNHSRSDRDVIRGLHCQLCPPMGKLMRVVHGRAYLVAVDLRVGSPTQGEWVGIMATDMDKKQLWAPAQFARGFCAMSPNTHIEYACTALYNQDGEYQIRWDDPDIGIEWPITNPRLSEKDMAAPCLREFYEHYDNRS